MNKRNETGPFNFESDATAFSEGLGVTASGAGESTTAYTVEKNIWVKLGGGVEDIPVPAPLPGITILVHGVNSDGEWYDQTEEGLCAGLNDRLLRRDEHLVHRGAQAGQLSPTRYAPELTPDGFIDPNFNPKSFILPEDTFSPVIRFRWGYKASGEELQKYGQNIYLNEEDYWGGGPFANGCSTLADLWEDGLSEELFLWLHVQHFNPVAGRDVYSCPPHAYFVLAAFRLAKLIESLRRAQADLPITIVCHSQGNMVAMAAAFFGDAMPEVSDSAGRSSRCVADNYVLCNPPYSLRPDNFLEDWSQRGSRDADGNTGRQTQYARDKTLAAFFDIMRQRAPLQQDEARIDARMANVNHAFSAKRDREAYGLNGSTYGRVTLYFSPHDGVISATNIQGIGWLGLSGPPDGARPEKESDIARTNAKGVFTQRVFAQGFKVGEPSNKAYDFWKDHYLKPPAGSHDFWSPHSPQVIYSVSQGRDASRGNFIGYVLTLVSSVPLKVATKLAKSRVHALPPNTWSTPLQAPALPEPFLPESTQFEPGSGRFDEGLDRPGEQRDVSRTRDADDPYAGDRTDGSGRSDAAKGDKASEATLRYEHHASLRMKAKREGLYKSDQKVEAEDKPETASEQYKAWRKNKIKTMLDEGLESQATDHSTIMGNPMHMRKALAYDVAVGVCQLSQEQLFNFRLAADWRLLEGIGKRGPFLEYFESGSFRGGPLSEWTRQEGSEGKPPNSIFNERQTKAQKENIYGG